MEGAPMDREYRHPSSPIRTLVLVAIQDTRVDRKPVHGDRKDEPNANRENRRIGKKREERTEGRDRQV